MKDKFEIVKAINKQTDLIEITISKEEFSDFYTFLNTIKKDFKDLCIENGEFRARSNDRICIVETGFSYFENISYCITDIRKLVQLLSVLKKCKKITVTFQEGTIIFTDSYQSVQLEKAYFDYLENKFVLGDEMEEIIYKNIDRQKPIISETLSATTVSNISKIIRNMKAARIHVRHEKENLSKGNLFIPYKSEYDGKTNAGGYSFELHNTFIHPMKRNHYFVLLLHPFKFDKGKIFMNSYININDRIITTIYTAKVGKLVINIYGRSAYSNYGE